MKSKICPNCYHKMTLQGSLYSKGKIIKSPLYRCGDCGLEVLI